MDAAAVIVELRSRGIEPVCSRGRLILKPRERVTPGALKLARQHRAALLALLSDPNDPDRIARLDTERHEHHRAVNRGYDYDPAAPGHRGYCERHGLPSESLKRPEPARPELDPAVAAELARIWPDAERLGWPRQRIWAARFWPIEARGLAALMDAGDRLVEVSADYIVIEKCDVRKTRQRFWRCDA